MIKIGIVGCGAMGSVIAGAVVKRFKGAAVLEAVCDVDKSRAGEMLKKTGAKADIVDRSSLIERCDLVIEAASGRASYEIAKDAIGRGKDVIVMSTGGLLGKDDIFGLAKAKGVRIYLPSGAVCGLDGLKGAMMAGVESVTLVTRKPPKGLEGAPYIVEKGIDLASIKDETVIFEGSAAEAVKGFPKNVNVSATLSMCGLGADKTRVKIVTSPAFKSNSHQVEVVGAFGKLTTRTENRPLPENPKTSYLAALSALATLESIVLNRRIGS